MLKGWAEDKSNTKTPDELLDSYIKCYNDSIANHVGKMHIGLHICRGKSFDYTSNELNPVNICKAISWVPVISQKEAMIALLSNSFKR